MLVLIPMHESQIEKAVTALKNGDVVGIPTETVYGLAASIQSNSGIKKIFAVKKRPFFDPLIVHVSSKKMAENLTTDWSPLVNYLAEHFWPGPLTLVLPKSSLVSDLITSGLNTVGIRMPRHSVALSLIDRLSIPLAAPSANLFGKTSPTTAAHVESAFKNENILVLDGGPCEVGVESTVLMVKRDQEKYQLSVLRAGNITQTELERSLNGARFQVQFVDRIDRKESPGHMKHHYMPEVPLVLVKKNATESEIITFAQDQMQSLPEQVEGVFIKKIKDVKAARELVLSRDSRIAARELYAELRCIAEEPTLDIIYFRILPEHLHESWAAVMDRLTKAASLVLQ